MAYSVALFCGSSPTSERSSEYLALAEEMGRLLAESNMQLVTGAGPGLMEAAARGAAGAGGLVRGVGLSKFTRAGSEYIHEFSSHDDLGSRQATLLEAANAYVALPGGPGTLYEVAQVLAFKRIHQMDEQKPLILVGPYFDTLVDFLQEIVREGFSGQELPKYFVHVSTPAEAVAQISAHASG